MNKAIVVTGAALAAAVGWLLLPGQKAEARAGKTVKIGMVDSLSRGLPPALIRLVMTPFKALMEAKTGMTGNIVEGGEPLALAKKMADDEVQLGVFHGHEFAWAKARYPKLTPVAICVNKTRTVRVHLVVHKSSAAKAVEDLKGKVVALPRTNRDHCRLFFESRCIGEECKPEEFYKELVRATDGEDALDRLFAGTAEAAVVDSVTLEAYKNDKPGRGKGLRTVKQSEAFPAGVIAYYSGRFAEADVRNFRAGLLDAKNTAKGRVMLEMLKLTAFEAAPADYDATLKAIAKAYPAPK